MKKSKRGGMNFTTLTVAIILVSMFALSIVELTAGLANRYNVVFNDSYPNTFNKINQITNQTNQINAQVTGADTSSGTSTTDALFQQGQAAIGLSFQSLGLISALLTDSADALNLPSYLVGGILGMIIVILSLLALTILMRAFQKL